MSLKSFYIYRHIRPDKNEVFYIGKGSSLSKSHDHRANTRHGRNNIWKNIVAKNNGAYISEIIYECNSEEECNLKEVEFISIYGRKDLNKGTLSNLTDGGEGAVGRIVPEHERENLRNKFSGEGHPNWGKKLSDETCRRKSETLKNSSKNLKGKKLPQWWKDKIRQSKFGKDNPMFGKVGSDSPSSKIVINMQTGIFYDSITLAADSGGYKMKTLSNMLVGHRKNTSNFKIA